MSLRVRVVLGAVLGFSLPLAGQTSAPKAAEAYTVAHRAEWLEQFTEFLSIPNVVFGTELRRWQR